MKIEIEGHKVQIGKYKINYVTSKLKNAKTEKVLLLIPGTFTSAEIDFKPQLKELPLLLPNYLLIAWDPPGYGKSYPPEREFTPEMINNDVKVAKNLIDILELKKFDILGWSAGGLTALYFTLKYPEYVDKLIIFGTPVRFTDYEINFYVSISDTSLWKPSARQQYNNNYGGAENFQRLWNNFVECTTKMKEFSTPKFDELMRKSLKEVKSEILILHGENDYFIAPDQLSLIQNIPNSHLIVIPRGSHDMHMKYSREFNQHVANFLKKKSKI